jgi:hypothetical protein
MRRSGEQQCLSEQKGRVLQWRERDSLLIQHNTKEAAFGTVIVLLFHYEAKVISRVALERLALRGLC